MEYLKEVGPDTMIPCFSVNLKGNKNVELCNAINSAIFNDLCHSSSEQTAHRIPLLVTSSSMVPHKHSNAVPNLKKRLGVSIILSWSYQDQIAQQQELWTRIGKPLAHIVKSLFCSSEYDRLVLIAGFQQFLCSSVLMASFFHKSVVIGHLTLSDQHSGP